MIPTRMIIGRFQVEEIIGQGGMGTVYRGRDTHTGQLVAVKHLKAEVVADDPSQLERFRREGEALRQLNHPNIVQMLAAFVEDNQHYLVMEYVGGGSLRDLLNKERQLPIRRILEIGLDLADALARAHRLNIIHRDIKPGNVLLAEDGTPRLTDFGVAHLGSQERITQAGTFTGTYAYVCPESFAGRAPDSRADVWSFGVLLYEMVAGRLPFAENQITSLILTIMSEEAPDLTVLRPDAPPALVELITAMLIKEPERRPASVRLVGAELESLLQGAPVGWSTSSKATAAVPDRQPVQAAAHTSRSTPRHQLPLPTTPFVGRAPEIKDIITRLSRANCQLLTLVGAGGMGKTRLSLEVAGRVAPDFADGVSFVPLAPLTSPDLIAGAIADVLHFSFQGDEPPGRQLINYVRDKKMLLVLDNFEHILFGADFVGEILAEARGVKVLATSRENLNLHEEWLFDVGGMRFPDGDQIDDLDQYSAVRLFLERAQRAQPDFSLEAEEANVIRICRLLDGMPLGLELAAAWLRTLSCAEIIQEISGGIDFLTTSTRNVTERHRSIRAVFDYSWNLLSPREQEAISQLSVFGGGFRRDAALAVAGASLVTLATLTEKSLLRRQADGRYDMHDLLRQYAAEKLAAVAETELECRSRHSAYFTAFLQQRASDLKGVHQLKALDEVREELQNARLAWQWAIEQYDLAALDRALESLYLFYELRGRFLEGEQLFQQAAALEGQETAAVLIRARLQARRAVFYEGLSRFDEAQRILQESLAVNKQHNVRSEAAFCLYYLGYILYKSGRQTGADDLLGQGLDLYRALGDKWGMSRCLAALALVAADAPAQERLSAESLALCREIGDQWGAARALMNLGAGNLNAYESRPLLEEALAFHKQIRNRFGQCHTLSHLANRVYWTGDYVEANRYSETALTLSRQLGDIWSRLAILSAWSNRSMLMGDYETARRMGQEAIVISRQLNDPQRSITILAIQARTEYRLSDQAATGQHLQEALALARTLDTPQKLAPSLNTMGFAAHEVNQLTEAESWFQESLALATANGLPLATAFAHNGLGLVADSQGDRVTAVNHYQAALAIHRESGETAPIALMFVYIGLGQSYAASGEEAAAGQGFKRAMALAQRLGRVQQLLAILVEMALLMSGDDPGRALELLAFVSRHPATEKLARDRSAQAEERLAALLSPAAATAARQRAAALTLEAAPAVAGYWPPAAPQ
jgi:predicted ATPase/predicted Ser/Thr protein kinase